MLLLEACSALVMGFSQHLRESKSHKNPRQKFCLKRYLFNSWLSDILTLSSMGIFWAALSHSIVTFTDIALLPEATFTPEYVWLSQLLPTLAFRMWFIALTSQCSVAKCEVKAVNLKLPFPPEDLLFRRWFLFRKFGRQDKSVHETNRGFVSCPVPF